MPAIEPATGLIPVAAKLAGKRDDARSQSRLWLLRPVMGPQKTIDTNQAIDIFNKSLAEMHAISRSIAASTHEQTQAAKAVANVVAVTDLKVSDMMGSIGGIASAVEIAENAATDLEKLASNLSCRATQLNEHLKLGTSEQVCNAACKIAP